MLILFLSIIHYDVLDIDNRNKWDLILNNYIDMLDNTQYRFGFGLVVYLKKVLKKSNNFFSITYYNKYSFSTYRIVRHKSQDLWKKITFNFITPVYVLNAVSEATSYRNNAGIIIFVGVYFLQKSFKLNVWNMHVSYTSTYHIMISDYYNIVKILANFIFYFDVYIGEIL